MNTHNEQVTELIQKLANAQITHVQCGGHNKAERNEWLVKEYKEQLQNLGVPIPEDKKLYEIGTFNGDGSS